MTNAEGVKVAAFADIKDLNAAVSYVLVDGKLAISLNRRLTGCSNEFGATVCCTWNGCHRIRAA